MKTKSLVFLAMILIASCGLKELKPIDQASVAGAEMSKTYISLYGTYNNLAGVLEGKDLETLKKTAPALNQAKQLLISYNSIVIAWRASGGDEPPELFKNKQLLDAIFAEISTIFMRMMP
jgi:hypothetical protein